MSLVSKKEAVILLIGDLLVFILSLWVMLLLRYSVVPTQESFLRHLTSFTPILFFWLLVFFIFGLYDRHTTAFKNSLPKKIFEASIMNAVIAVFSFYLFSYLGITPKTNLFIYTLISVFLIFIWRQYLAQSILSGKGERVVIVGDSPEIVEIRNEIDRNRNYRMSLFPVKNVEEALSTSRKLGIRNIIMDLESVDAKKNKNLVYELIFSGAKILDAEEIYESIFNVVPLSYLNDNWFMKNTSEEPMMFYDSLKRIMDFIISFILGAFSLVLYPFVYLAIKLDDGGPVFVVQERVGKNNKIVTVRKFRSMTKNDSGEYGKRGRTELRVTRVGKLLRKTRIDELPQLWNVLVGEISLVGPRPELPSLVRLYEREIPYYNVRHLIMPGLSGWAQIYQENHPHHGEAVMETKEKLSYDLYYLKNRSFILDIEIALKTIKTLLSRSGK